MTAPRVRFGRLLTILALLMLAGASARAEEYKNQFYVVVNENGIVIEGVCDGDYPEWYYYENTRWWNQWFYNGPYDPDRMKVVDVALFIMPMIPDLPVTVEIAYNWATPRWKPGSPPPLPPLEPSEEEMYIGRHTFFTLDGAIVREPIPVTDHFEILEYNPEWISIDVRGTNFIIQKWGTIIHECVDKPVPSQACCFKDGHCEDLTPTECKRKGGDPQGSGTNCATTKCPQPAVEVDNFPNAWAEVQMVTPLGTETVELTGPAKQEVYFEGPVMGEAYDDDGDGKDEVETEMVSMSLTGMSSMGPIKMRLRTSSPASGEIEEHTNNTPGVLDTRPFVATGLYNCDSFFDLYFEIEVGGGTYTTEKPKRLAGVISHKPPAPCELLENDENTAVYDAAGNPTGFYVGPMKLRLVPCAQVKEACCLPDGTCTELTPDECLARKGTPQGPGTQCTTPEACCLDDGSCIMVDPLCCDEQGGKPMGAGTACSAAQQACCLPNGECIMADPLCCIDKGGIPQGSGTTCTGLRPCCLPDGACIMVDPLCCDELHGVPSPIGAATCLGDLNGDGIDDACQELPSDDIEYGDAPEASVAYPSLCVQGAFPTCVGTGPASWIQHANSKAYFGNSVDFENEGNAGKCPVFTPDTYDQDECFQDGDAGLIMPPAYTIQGPIGLETVVPCKTGQTGSLGQICQTAVWGTDIDIKVVNGNADARRYVNVLVDWNHDGKWGGSLPCPGPVPIAAAEHVLVNFNIPAGYSGPLSNLNPPNFLIGPWPGYAWTRFTITEKRIMGTWDGSGSFEDGESEDYLLHVLGLPKPYDCHWSEGDDHKMHWPQLPDLTPTGIDVDNFWVPLADDFMCTRSGPIKDIHIWGSFAGDCLPPAGVAGMTFQLRIYTNVPADVDPTMPWSHPGEPRWTRVFEPCQYTVRKVHEGPEDWYDPATGEYQPAEHFQAYQFNFCIDEEPYFIQEEGVIYWLEVKDITPDDAGATFGWKTTRVEPEDLRYNDDAVWFNEDPTTGQVGWLPLTYPDGHKYQGETLDLAFVITGEEEVPEHDLGDAPDSSNSFPVPTLMTAYPKGGPLGTQANYPTVFGAGSPPWGPLHLQPKAVAWLGHAVTLENEADIGPDEDGVNNLDPPNDKPDQDEADDSVQIPLELPHCKQTSFNYGVQIVPGAPWSLDLYVNVWLDWTRDGDWDDAPQCPSTAAVIVADEWAVQNQKISGFGPGYYVIATPLFRCWHPTGEDDPDPIWMRITLSEQEWDPIAGTVGYGGAGPQNGYLYGETEDYYFVPKIPEPKYDWGDATDGDLVPGYPTLAINNGAHHMIGGPWLGDATDGPDAEPDGQPDPNATGDDNDGNDDEDGVFIPPLIRGQTVHATALVNGGGGMVQVWVDFNGDQTWQAGEEVFNGMLANGPQIIPIPVPNGAVLGYTYARFRISVNGGLGPDGGPAPDGEVEDHEVLIKDPPPDTKWINLPDLTPFGIDIRVDDMRVIADDFECRSESRVTDVHLWCSWKDDIKGNIKNIHLSIHADDPAGPGGPNPDNVYSQPAPDPLWTGDFGPGQFKEVLYGVVPDPCEYWWDPATNELIRGGDSEVWRIDIDINPDEAFLQKGSPDNPLIYWLDVRMDTEGGQVGWKTRQWPDHYMDDAVWDRGSELPRQWKELRYPAGHPYHGLERDSIDMAFVITVKKEEPPPKPPVKHVKWSQPPIERTPMSRTPNYCGWDEPSHSTPAATKPFIWKGVADDFRCLGSMPICSVHWWGSHIGWNGDAPPATKPSGWVISFWSNIVWSTIPPGTDPDYSHPGKLLWKIRVPADRVQVEKVGIDRFPDKPMDTCFQYYVELEPKEYFWQEKYTPQTQDNIFWISITALYTDVIPVDFYEWGWKTRPWHWMDDAVRFELDDEPELDTEPGATAFTPIEETLNCAGVTITQSFDMAFELDTDPRYIKWEQPYTGIRHWRHYEDEESMALVEKTTETVTKYRQPPDLSEKGIDVDATWVPTTVDTQWANQLLADDFPCTTTGPLTDIHIWGSWYNDEPPGGDPCHVTFKLSIHKDIPADESVTGYSMPGEQEWERIFQPGEFTVEEVATDVPEGYYSPCGPIPVIPPTFYIPQNHFKAWKYNFYIEPSEAFTQEGTPDNKVIYWLDVEAQPMVIGATTDARFGWKTSKVQWNDDAVWRTDVMTDSQPWVELTYPEAHPYHPNSLDLAFEITTEEEKEELKIRRLVADDWLCRRETPLTAAVWWGSYIGYTYQACECPEKTPPVKPDYFLLSIWTDVRPTAEVPYSHPGEKVWEYEAHKYDEVLVGYDKYPHDSPSEPVFRYSVRLPEDKWFCQDGVDRIYWFSVMAVYKSGSEPVYPWGWTNHQCKAWEPVGLEEVAHWKFDETSGSTASDSSGNDNHGTLVNGPKWQVCCGAICGALDFDGEDDYVKTADTTTGLDFAPNSFSVSVWVNAREVTDGWRTILEYDRDGTDDNRFGLWLSSEGELHFRVGLDTMNSNEKLNPDKWYLLIGTYDSADKKMSVYINGSLDSSEAQSGGFATAKATKLTIGVRGSEDGEYFNGLIDDVRIYDYVLSEADIKGLAHMSKNDDAVAGHLDTSGAWKWEPLYDQTGMSDDMSFILFTDCFPCTYSTYPDWLALGKPRCWCDPYHCDGDADGKVQGFQKYRVMTNDQAVLQANWKKTIGDATLDPCADVDHKPQGFQKYRVMTNDLARLILNWKKVDRGDPYDPTTQLPADCPRPE